MNPLILAGVFILVPVALSFVLRVNPTLMFASLLAGFVLTQFVTDDASLVVSAAAASTDINQFTQIGLFVGPTVFTLFFARKSSNKTLRLLQPVVAIANGVLFAILIQPMLPSQLTAPFLATQVGTTLLQAKDLFVGAIIVLNLSLIWLSHQPHHSKHE